MQLTGNTILITGGGSGIGRGLAGAFHKLGNKVIIAGRRKDVLDQTTGANPGMASIRLDIDDPAAILAFAKKIVAEHPALNVLINNSGIMRLEDLVNHPEDLSGPEAVITTNLLGPIRLTSALLPQLARQSHPVIMNVTSSLAFAPLAFAPVYCATKAALHSWTESLRYQLSRTGTEVIELVPPYLQTELTGSRQASDPMAMPLNDFILESMQILQSLPGVAEVVVENAKPQRFAAEGGTQGYNALVNGFNDAIAKMMSA
ncbi:MAG: SDR family NAD(P)-dependent oxidoreductase [Terracidiphilus sp.]